MDLGKGLACRGRCEEDVKAINALLERGMNSSARTAQILQESRKTRLGSAVFMLACGAVFLAMGLSNEDQFSFMTMLGGCFMAYGLFSLWSARKASALRREALQEIKQ